MTTPAISGYTFDTCRGGGAFGTVWRALWNGEFECAVKGLTPGMWHPQYLSWCLERLRREGDRVDLVRVYSYDLANNPSHIAMAMLPEGTMSLEQLSGRLPARDAWLLLDGLAATLSWLHGEGIVHTGLSSGNVFVCSGPSGDPVVLVSDVGQGWLSEASVSRLHGQIGFIAPEHWRAATKLLQEGRAQGRDVYAFGVIAWRLLTGSWPRGAKVFDAIAESEAEDLNLQTEPFADWLEREEAAEWPAEAASEEEKVRRDLVLKCLSMDAGERFPDMKAVREVLQSCPLPPPVVASPVDSIALDAEADADAEPETNALALASVVDENIDADANGDGVVDTADAFAAGEEAAPRRRGFRIPFPKLSLSLRSQKDNREESAPAPPRVLPWRVATALAALATVGVTSWGLKEREGRITASSDRDNLRAAKDDLSSRLPRVEGAATAAKAELQAVRAEQTTAARNNAVELAVQVLATQPVDEPQWPAWRTAVRAVAERCQPLLENAPADAAGMEARWQLARLKHALGDDPGALPVLEKLTRDLEAAAIAGGRDFPLELVRLTGRVSALTGTILTLQNRTEDAMPCLRKASDSLERWLATNEGDRESVRMLAQNLLLEGRCLASRGQAEQARGSLMKIEGLIGEAKDPGYKPEDCFIKADAQMEGGHLDSMEAAALPSSDPAAKENNLRLLNSAIGRFTDGLDLLIAYDGKENSQSVACRTRMARGYYELGRLLARSGEGYNASVAFSQAVSIYRELLGDFEDNSVYKFELAALYNEAAQLIRTATPGVEGAKEALDYQNYSVDYLKYLRENNPLDTKIRLLYATSLTLNGELLEQAKDNTKALGRHTEAITITGELLAENTLSEKDRREARRISARSWTSTAGLHERAGPRHREDTVHALNKALADWESSPVEDPSDQKMMAWVKDKLSKLK